MKVHFAGYQSFIRAIDRAGVNYVLNTFYEMRGISEAKQQEVVSALSLRAPTSA